MLCCTSNAVVEDDYIAKHSREIDKESAKDNRVSQRIITLLLLGTGASGKSTVFKQLITIHGRGHSEQVRKEARKIVHRNIIESMHTLIEQSEILPESLNTRISSNLAEDKQAVMNYPAESHLTPEIVERIQRLWRDPGIMNTYENRSLFHLDDGAAYLFGRLPEIIKPDYIPNNEDFLRIRVRTTGITETHFDIHGRPFRMLDVGGQRNERKKWSRVLDSFIICKLIMHVVHCFQGVTAVMFVVAISEYDQNLFEDNEKNSLIESLELFEEICNSEWFINTSIALFFNKRDLFLEKLPRSPLKNLFSEYTGGANYDAAIDFLKKLFFSKNQVGRNLYMHVTCATDKDNVAFVFEAVSDTLLSQTLAGGGLL